MYEKPLSRWGRARQRLAWAGRILLALAAGTVFAIVAWEPPSSMSKGDRDSENAVNPAGPSAVREVDAGSKWDSMTAAQESDEVFGWTPKRDKDGKQTAIEGTKRGADELDRIARSSGDPSDENDSPAIVNPHSRSPPP